MADQNIPSVQESIAAPSEAAEQAVETTSQDSADQQQASTAQATLTDPNASKAVKKAAEKTLKKLKLKVDGQEEELEFDPNDDTYLTEQLQLAKVARKRMQEKSIIEKEVIQFINDLRKNPKKALSDPAIGVDIKELARQIIEEEIENSRKSPEQLEKEKLESELKAIKEEREKEKEEQRQREFERIKEQEYERYDILMSQALEKTDLPKTPYIVKKMADYMLMGLESGKDVSPEDVIPLVREEMQQDLKEMFAVMPDEVIESLIGKDKLNSIRKKNIAKAKQSATNPALKASTKAADTGKSSEKEDKDKPKISYKDFFKGI